MTNEASSEGMSMDVWTVTEAKAKLNELIDRARSNRPQTITRKGHAAVVVVAAEEWKRITGRTGNLAEFFAVSPLRGAKLKVERVKSGTQSV